MKSKVKILKERLLKQVHDSSCEISSSNSDENNQFLKNFEDPKASSLGLELPQSLKMSPNFPCLALRGRQPSINKLTRLFREGMNGLSGSALIFGEESEALFLLQAAINKSLVERKARYPSAADITPQIAVIPCNTVKSNGETLIQIASTCLSGSRASNSTPLESLEATLRVARKEGMPAVIVLSNFEHLVFTKRQSLLFTLLDLAHREDLLFLVIGITTRSDIHIHLEKRVYSRLNARYIFLPELTADDICKELCYYLSAPIYPTDSNDLKQFIQSFNNNMAKLFGYYLVKKYTEKFKSKNNKRSFSDSEFSHLTEKEEEDFELKPFHTSTMHDGEDREYLRDSRCILVVTPIRVKDAPNCKYLQEGESGGGGELRKYLKLIASKGLDPQELDMWVLRVIFNIGSTLENGEDEDDEDETEDEEKKIEEKDEEEFTFPPININEKYKEVDMNKILLTSKQFIEIVESQNNPELIQILIGLSYYEICLYACCARRQCAHNIDQLHYISQAKKRTQKEDDDNIAPVQEVTANDLNTLKHILKLGGDECEMTINEVLNDFDKLTEAVSKGILSSKKIIDLFFSLREKGLINFWTSTLRSNDPFFYNYNITLEGSTILTVNHHKEEINAAFRHKGNQQLVIIDRVRSAVTEPLIPLTYKA